MSKRLQVILDESRSGSRGMTSPRVDRKRTAVATIAGANTRGLDLTGRHDSAREEAAWPIGVGPRAPSLSGVGLLALYSSVSVRRSSSFQSIWIPRPGPVGTG